MNRYLILLGSNIDKERNLAEAVRLLAEATYLVAVSAAYETPPKGLLEQPSFLNAAALVESHLSPAELKAGPLADIEHKLKRVRQKDRNAPRTIDLDIGLQDEVVGIYPGPDGRNREIPDPDILRFAHAAVPIAELLPDARHPQTGETFKEIADRLLSFARDQGDPPIQPRKDIDLRQQLVH